LKNAIQPQTDTDAWLQVAGMTKRYGHLVALDDVCFSIRRGEILGLIGPNGAGKTTLFECMAGVLPPTAGDVLLAGRPLSDRARRQTLFYLPDAVAPWPAQSVRWALDFAVGFLGGRADRLAAVIDGLALTSLLASTVGTLSKGQRKRVLLAIGLLTPQPLLLSDEPFEGLDASLKASLDGAPALEYTLGTTPGPGRNGAPPNPDLFPENNAVLRPPVAGKVGLWAKTDSTSYFKDYVVSSK
jgi:ABC-type Mn2+/Zn2+ transport system ATPase subunit